MSGSRKSTDNVKNASRRRSTGPREESLNTSPRPQAALAPKQLRAGHSKLLLSGQPPSPDLGRQSNTFASRNESDLDHTPSDLDAFLRVLARTQKTVDFQDLPAGMRAASIRAHMIRQDLRIAAVGITKAGKSTLLNALIGREFLPSPNVPATARPVLICHDETMQAGACRVEGEVFSSEHEARTRIQALHEITRKNGEAASPLKLDVRVAALEGARPPDGWGIAFVDTPGVTESDSAILQDATIQQISEADVLLLVLSFGEQGSSAERLFFSTIARLRPDFFLRPDRRLFLALTKVDKRDRHGKGRLDTANYLRENVEVALQKSLPDLHCAVWELQADSAVLAQAMAGSPTLAQVGDYRKLLFGKAGAHVSALALSRHAERTFALSGVPPLVQALRSRVVNHAPAIRLDAIRSRSLHSGRKTVIAAYRSGNHATAVELRTALEQLHR